MRGALTHLEPVESPSRVSYPLLFGMHYSIYSPMHHRLTSCSIQTSMVNPGAFRGARFTFLVEQKPLYANAVVGGHVADCLADIQRRYFKRFAVDAPHDVDPPADFLNGINDDEADAEPEAPDESSMSPPEYRAALRNFKSRQALIATRKDVCACLASFEEMLTHFFAANQALDGLPAQ